MFTTYKKSYCGSVTLSAGLFQGSYMRLSWLSYTPAPTVRPQFSDAHPGHLLLTPPLRNFTICCENMKSSLLKDNVKKAHFNDQGILETALEMLEMPFQSTCPHVSIKLCVQRIPHGI